MGLFVGFKEAGCHAVVRHKAAALPVAEVQKRGSKIRGLKFGRTSV